MTRKFPTCLKEAKYKIEKAAREYGLDFFPTVFEMVDWNEMCAIGSYTGYPSRYHHWRFGMDYDRMYKQTFHGLSTYYELVVNNDPCYAYLLDSNTTVAQEMVIAHVYAHGDYFKNNVYFTYTNRKMLNEFANHASQIQKYINRFGPTRVEKFIDTCLSLEDLIDPFSVVFKKDMSKPSRWHLNRSGKIDSPQYMDSYINPPEVMKKLKEKRLKEAQRRMKNPPQPTRDILLFLVNNAPLKRWQKDILSMIREESYYFLPQKQTKISNEGWACITGDSLVITENGFVPIKRAVDWCEKTVGYDNKLTNISKRCITKKIPTIKIKTNKGLYLEAAEHHRLIVEKNGILQDVHVKDLEINDKISIACGLDIWPKEKIEVDITPCLYRMTFPKSKKVSIPKIIDEDLAYIMGALVAEGHQGKRSIEFTNTDSYYLQRFCEKINKIFGIEAIPCPRKEEPHKSDVVIYSSVINKFFQQCGLYLYKKSEGMSIPWSILQSPKSVISSFLAGYFDGDGCVYKAGTKKQIIFNSKSFVLINQIATVLLNYGILGSYNINIKDGYEPCHQLRIGAAKCFKIFKKEIPIKDRTKLKLLDQAIQDIKFETNLDEAAKIISIEYGNDINYDWEILDGNHYVAQGFINHNTYWHNLMMTGADRQNEYKDKIYPNGGAPLPIMGDSGLVDFGDLHSSIARGGHGLNPYWLGLQIWRDIEDRWNKGKFGKEYEECEDYLEREKWDKKLGLGRKKIFEVRKNYDDFNLIHEFLTKDLVAKLHMFTYGFDNPKKAWYVTSKNYDKIKKGLMFKLTNAGQPVIRVEDGNYLNKGILLLTHDKNDFGFILKEGTTVDVLRRIRELWTRPVYLKTWTDKGEPTGYALDEHGTEIEEKWWEDQQEEKITEEEFDDIDKD